MRKASSISPTKDNALTTDPASDEREALHSDVSWSSVELDQTCVHCGRLFPTNTSVAAEFFLCNECSEISA